MLRIWSLVGTGERIPGSEREPERVHYSIDWDAVREYREARHPDWSVPDTEAWEIPTIMRRIVGWLNEGAGFFLASNEEDEESEEIADDEVGAWIL